MPRRRAVLGGGMAAVAAPAGVSDPVRKTAPSTQGVPGTVPSAREATPGSGDEFSWTGEGRRIVDDSAGGRLTADAETFVTDLAGCSAA